MKKSDETLNIDHLMAQGISLHQEGELEQAKLIYEKVLRCHAQHYEALHYLGLIFAQQGKLSDAEIFIRRAILVNSEDEKSFINLGLILQGLNHGSSALAAFDSAIAINGLAVEAHYNRACLLQSLGCFQDAISGFNKALELRPNYPEALNNRGNAQDELHLFEQAIESYKKALLLRPNYPECLYNLGIVLSKIERFVEALGFCHDALNLLPNDPDILNATGYIQMSLNKHEEALKTFEKSLTLFNDYAETYLNRGQLLFRMQKQMEALEDFNQALKLRPNYPEALNSRARLLVGMQQNEAAVESCNRAIEFRPTYAEAFINRGNAFYGLGHYHLAIADYKRALELDSESVEAKWALAIALIPPVVNNAQELEESRNSFEEALSDLNKWFKDKRLEIGHQIVGSKQPFFLAYQDQNNRELLEKYGNICIRLMEFWQKKNNLSFKKTPPNKKIRIGIVSNHIHDHSVWNAIIKGWVSELSHEYFELYLFYFGDIFDSETEFAKSKVKAFIHTNQPLEDWVKSILENNIDILIYPEIGMHAETMQLASLRLAPLQIASWGHPESTGLKTIDYYLSAELMEVVDAEKNYVENLYTLPNIGCYYFPLKVPSTAVELHELGLSPDKPILLCPGTPYKYLEKYDSVFIEIIKLHKDCQLAFFTSPRWNFYGIEERLRRKFENACISFDDHIKFLPWLSRDKFFGLMNHATLYLDTIGFSGFNTAMQAIECNLPIVTMRTKFLRGNLASAPLIHMGLSNLVVKDQQEYVAQVIKLVTDDEYRKQIRQQIEDRKHSLFKNKLVISKFEEFLLKSASTIITTE